MSNFRSLKKYLKYLLIIAVLVASLRVFIFSLRFFLGTDNPLVVVEGPSMEPTYFDGDLLVVKGVVDVNILEPPDVIVFLEPENRDKYIVHRIIQKIDVDTRAEFVTKGDNNLKSDYDYWGWTVDENDIIGVVIAKVPPLFNTIIIIIESQVTTVFTVAIIIIFIGADAISDREKEEETGKISL